MTLSQKQQESLIGIVGFLGAGKTTLLKRLVGQCLDADWDPYVILNDVENATMDAQQLVDDSMPTWIKPLAGSCICCSGIHELREFVNRIPERPQGLTLIEANGTSDAVSLMGFLGVGIEERFHSPVQVSVVDVRYWQKRGEHNELEANQVQVSSLIGLTHEQGVSEERRAEVLEALRALNPSAPVLSATEISVHMLTDLKPSGNQAVDFDHHKAHIASCSVDLPSLPNEQAIHQLCDRIPETILRVKGCMQLAGEEGYTYFERGPDGAVHVRPLNGEPLTGPKLLVVGPGSSIDLLENAIQSGLQSA